MSQQAWRLEDPVKWAPQYLQGEKWAPQYLQSEKWAPQYIQDDKSSFFPRYGSSLSSTSGIRSMSTVIKKLGGSQGGFYPSQGGIYPDLYPAAAGEAGPAFWRPPNRVRYL
jgi:hypothetical protein